MTSRIVPTTCTRCHGIHRAVTSDRNPDTPAPRATDGRVVYGRITPHGYRAVIGGSHQPRQHGPLRSTRQAALDDACEWIIGERTAWEAHLHFLQQLNPAGYERYLEWKETA